MGKFSKNFPLLQTHLLAHRNSDTAIAAPAPHHTMHPPRSRNRNQRGVQVTIHLQRDSVHLERNQRRRIAPPVHVRLVARYVRVVDDSRVGDHGVNHRRRRKKIRRRRRRRLLHRLRLRRRDGPILPEVYPLRQPQPVLHCLHEVVNRHNLSKAFFLRWQRDWLFRCRKTTKEIAGD